VGVISPNCVEYGVLYFGNALARTATACVPHQLAQAELVTVINGLGCRVLVVHESVRCKVESVREQLVRVEQYVCIGQGGPSYTPFAELARRAPGDDPLDGGASAEEVVLLLLTSGTTSTPKAAQHTHRSITWFGWHGHFDQVPLRTSTTIMFNSMAWVGAQVITMIALRRLSRIVIMRGFDCPRFAELAIRYGAAYGAFAPKLVYELTRFPPDRVAELRRTLRIVSYGGGCCSPAVTKAFRAAYPHTMLMQMWGMTEANMGTFLSFEDHKQGGRVLESCGRAAPGVVFALRDGDTGEIHQEPERMGELLIKTPGMFSGYCKNEAATTASFVGGFFRTGDVALLDDAGYIYIKGRVKDIIANDVGYKIYAREVEDVLMEHPDVVEVAVTGVPGEHNTEIVWAYVVPRAGRVIEHEHVRQHCNGRLAEYKWPAGTTVIARLPRNHNGKVVKRSLPPPE